MENQRIRLSKALLKTGLLKLLKEKPLNQISIYELCETSQINRTTFYKYYGSQSDLLAEIESDFLTQLDEDLKRIIAQNPDALFSVLAHLYEQREIFCILVQRIPSQDFTAHLFDIPSIGMIFQNMVHASSYSEEEAKYIRKFVFQGTFAILFDWLNSDTPEPVEHIAAVFGHLRNKLY